MKRIISFNRVSILSLFVLLIFLAASCEDFQSEEFQISDSDAKACNQLQRDDSLGYDTVNVKILTDFDSTWTNSALYDSASGTYSHVTEILTALTDSGIVVTNTTTQKAKIHTVATEDTNYIALQSQSGSLTFYFDRSVSINIIRPSGEIVRVSDETMPLETAAGCIKADDNDIQVPFIQARFSISVPDNSSLLQLIKNEQTKSNSINVSIL